MRISLYDLLEQKLLRLADGGADVIWTEIMSASREIQAADVMARRAV